MEVHQKRAEPWKVTLVDTGDNSMTGGRLRRVADYVKDDESFCFTYGDGVGDIDISAGIAFHKKHGKAATLTGTYPPARFGALDIEDGEVKRFKEKPRGDGALINGGFFVLSPKVLSLLDGDATVWEQEPLMKLAADGQLMAFPHYGFWQPMDTLHDKNTLEKMWADGLLAEVEHLIPQGIEQGITARRAIGYAQALAQLSGEMTEQDAIEETQAITRRYARRQVSWFKRYADLQWLPAGGVANVSQVISQLSL